jgi:ABC-2 type transport system ATP-binding protein
MIGKLAGEGRAILVSSHILTELAEMCDRVGIIEHGQLLAVGTVDEILDQQTEVDAATEEIAKIAITVLSDVDEAKSWLASKQGVEVLQTIHRTIQVAFTSDQEQQADLLAEMIREGIRVVGFAGKQKSLEDVFLSVTKGRVQ